MWEKLENPGGRVATIPGMSIPANPEPENIPKKKFQPGFPTGKGGEKTGIPLVFLGIFLPLHLSGWNSIKIQPILGFVVKIRDQFPVFREFFPHPGRKSRWDLPSSLGLGVFFGIPRIRCLGNGRE